jgi:hypothetical protein
VLCVMIPGLDHPNEEDLSLGAPVGETLGGTRDSDEE